eukprot:3193904-Rhodomonas_salina.1
MLRSTLTGAFWLPFFADSALRGFCEDCEDDGGACACLRLKIGASDLEVLSASSSLPPPPDGCDDLLSGAGGAATSFSMAAPMLPPVCESAMREALSSSKPISRICCTFSSYHGILD